MSFNQKMVSVLTVLAVGITVAITFTFMDPPYSFKFWVALFALIFAQAVFGAFWVQQISRVDAVLPVAIASWGLNAGYFAFTLLCTLLTGIEEKYFVLLHVVGFAVFVICHVLFRIVEHHVEMQSRDEELEPKIGRATVTWR